MDAFYEWGLEFIAAVQGMGGPALDGFFRAVTFLGEQEFYLLLMPLFFWCVDAAVGVRVTVAFLLSAYLNTGIKELLQEPRPFHLDPSLQRVDTEGYGFPSGHAQQSVVVWGVIAHWARKRWVWVAAVLLMLLIGFSRIYLGVHFPDQVLAGWVLGGLLLALYGALHLKVQAWINNLSMTSQLLLALVPPILLVLLVPADDTVGAMAVLTGLGIGLMLLGRHVPYRTDGAPWQRVVRYLVGLVGVLVFYLGLKAVLPADGEPLYLVFRYLRYGLVGLWVGLGAPWCFFKLRLMPSAPDEYTDG